jgi:hypothetical protein
MKTKIVIDIESKDFSTFYNSQDPEEKINISKRVEKALHEAIYQAVELYLNSDQFTEDIFEVPEGEYFPIDEHGTLCDYGDIKITSGQEGEKDE